MIRKKDELIPDFLIIGAGKSGTTSLNNYLKQHPQLFIAPVKEPNFFGYELNTATDFTDDDDELNQYLHSVTDIESYRLLFKEAENGRVKGETSNTYMYHETAPERIKYYNPDIKLIAILRQPAERLWSRYLHLARDGRLPTENFTDCLDEKTIWWKRNDLIREGFYFRNLSRYFHLFPENQLKVYLYEELNDRAEIVLEDIFAFLGVDPQFKPNLKARYNQSGIVKNKKLDRFIGTNGVLQRSAKYVFGTHYHALKNNQMLQGLVNRIRGKNLEKPGMDPEIRKILSTQIYREDILSLQKLIRKDLSAWLR